MNENLQTVWPEQQRCGPQASQQLAVTTGWVQVELVCVTGLPDSLCYLHPDTNNTNKQRSERSNYCCRISQEKQSSL